MNYERNLEEENKFINRCQTNEQKEAVSTIKKFWDEYNDGIISAKERTDLLDEYLNSLSESTQDFLFNEKDRPNNKSMSLIVEITEIYSQIPKVRR